MYTDRKVAILDAFIKLVSRFGMDKTTMQDVAKEVGISVGVIYKDFTNKEDLVTAYVDNLLDELVNECRVIIEQEKPAEELLHEFIISYFNMIGTFLTENRGFYQLLSDTTGFKFFQNNESYKVRMEREITALIKKIMEKGIAEGTFEIGNLDEISKLFLIAFDTFLLQMTLQMKSVESVLPNVEKMYQLLIRVIVKK